MEANKTSSFYGKAIQQIFIGGDITLDEFQREKAGANIIPDHDIMWGLLNKRLLEHAQKNQWGLYRNTRLDMAGLLKEEKRLGDALRTCLEICYIDLNDSYAPSLAPKVIEWIEEIAKEKNLNYDNIKKIYLEHNTLIKQSLKLSFSVEQGWELLDKELKKESI